MKFLPTDLQMSSAYEFLEDLRKTMALKKIWQEVASLHRKGI